MENLSSLEKKRKRDRERLKKRYYENKQLENEKRKLRRQKQLSCDVAKREQVREYVKQWYERNQSRKKKRSNENRRKANPFVGVISAIRDCKKGIIEPEQLYRIINASLNNSIEKPDSESQ